MAITGTNRNSDNFRLTGSMSIDDIKKVVDDNGHFVETFIDKDGFGERDVFVHRVGEETYYASCQDYDDNCAFHDAAGSWSDIVNAVQSYI